MPWRETSTMSLRREFCSLAQQEEANVSELCRRFGISRKTGYKWLARYRSEGEAGLGDHSRRPHSTPGQTVAAQEGRVLALRDAHPTWGGRKLRRRLQDLGEPAPAASTITAILRRGDRLAPSGPTHHPAWHRFEHDSPNALWQMDFKGDFPLARGRCFPLHVLDDHSRFVLGVVACANQRTETVRDALTAIFRRCGLPWRLLCDHGAPWGTVHAEAGLTTLGAWLVRLGIEVTHGRPRHPQTQGKLERANRTLDEDVVRRQLAIGPMVPPPTSPTLAACQHAFDAWRTIYNHERPHEALGLATPSTRYYVSPRPFPEQLPNVTYDTGDLVRRVQANGMIDFRGRTLRVSKALVGEPVAVRPTTTDGVWTVHYSFVTVRTIDLRGSSATQLDDASLTEANAV